MSSTRLTREVTYEVVDDAGGLVKLGADGESLEVAGSLSGQTELSTIIRRSIVETWSVPVNVLDASTPEIIEVSYSALTANGESGTETTSVLTATLSEEIAGLTIDNIVVTGASKVSLGGSPTNPAVEITNLEVNDAETVSLGFVDLPEGYSVTPESRDVVVHVAEGDDVTGQGTVYPDMGQTYTGHDEINITGLVIDDFEIVETLNQVPKQLIAKVRFGDIRTSGGNLITGAPIDEFKELDLRFVITHRNGDPVEDYFGYLHPITEESFDHFSDTNQGTYHGFLPIDGDFDVTLVASGRNGAGFVRTATLKKELAPITKNTYPARYIDIAAGNEANDGLSIHKFTGPATYNNATKRVFASGAFTGLDLDAARSHICPIYHYDETYLTGANEPGFPAGSYKIASKISDDEIELAEALGADYTGVTFSSGPKALVGTVTATRTYIKGDWARGSALPTASNFYLFSIGGKSRITNTQTGASVLAGGFGGSGSIATMGQCFLGEFIVDGEFKNNPISTAMSSSGTGIIRNLFHNVEFERSGGSSTVVFAHSTTSDWLRSFTFIGCKFNGHIAERAEWETVAASVGATSITLTGDFEQDVPLTGFFHYWDANARYRRVAFSGWDGAGGLTLSSALAVAIPGGKYCITSNSLQHSYNVNIKKVRSDWDVGMVHCEFLTDCKDDEKDHDYYINGHLDNVLISYNKFGKGMGSSYAINGNLSKGIAGTVHRNIAITDNYMSKDRRFAVDMSITNLGAVTEMAFGVLVARNHSNVMAAFAYYNAARGIRFADNYHEDTEGLGNQSSLWAFVVRAQGVGSGSLYTAIIDRNTVKNLRLVKMNQDEAGLQITDNVNSLNFNAPSMELDDTAYVGGAITRNNLYAPLSSVVAKVNGSDYSLEAFNTLVSGVNISENPDAINQYVYNVADESEGAGLPSFLREANNTAAYTSVIEDATRPGGDTGKVWKIKPNADASNMALIFNEIAKQSGDVEILTLSRGNISEGSVNRYAIPRGATRIKEYATSTLPEWVHGGIRPADGDLRIRTLLNGTLSTEATTAFPVVNWTGDWHYTLIKQTASGLISVTSWKYVDDKPETPQLPYDDTLNRLAGEYLGITGWNAAITEFAYIAVGLNGASAPMM
jgi:hypothetical protein